MQKGYKTIYLRKMTVGSITFTHVLSKNPEKRIRTGENLPVISFQRKRIATFSTNFSK